MADDVRVDAEEDRRRTATASPGRALFRIATGLAVATLVLVVINSVVFLRNQAAQVEVNRRQEFINQSVQLGRVHDYLVRALATVATNNKDDSLRALLAEHGITFNVTPTAAPAPAPAAPASGR